METMWTPILQIAPLAILLLGAVIVVFRGMRRKPDDTHNRAKGGRSASRW